jgi:hypothetical protein
MRLQIATVAFKQRILAPSALRKRGQETQRRKEHTVIAKLGESACRRGSKPLPLSDQSLADQSLADQSLADQSLADQSLADQSLAMTAAHALGARHRPRQTRSPSLRHREESSCV